MEDTMEFDSEFDEYDDDFESSAEFDEYDEYDEFDDIESFDDFGDAEDDERRRRRRRRRRRPRRKLKTARRGNPTVRRPSRGYATKAELTGTAKKLDGRIATNARAIKALDGRTRASERELGRVGSALRKEISVRKKQTTKLKKGLDESRQIAMMLPIISSIGGDNQFTRMLPILMYSGAFGGSGDGGFGGSGSNSMMMPMMMMMAFQPAPGP